jgi:hypothetical protein
MLLRQMMLADPIRREATATRAAMAIGWNIIAAEDHNPRKP